MKNQTYISYLTRLKKQPGITQVKIVNNYALEQVLFDVTYKRSHYLFSFGTHGRKISSSPFDTLVQIFITDHLLYKGLLKDTTMKKTIDALETRTKLPPRRY